MKSLILIALSLLAIGCSGKYVHRVEYNTLEPLRVAVLPFAEVNSKGEFITADDSLLIDKVAVVSQDIGEPPSTLVRKMVQEELGRSALSLLTPTLVDGRLSHAGYADEKIQFIYPKIFAASPQDFCPKVLDCDAVLFGKVTRWDRSYYGVQSVTTVGVELKLVSAIDGKVLFTASAEDSDSRGLSKIPTGFSSLFLEPIRGLDNDITVKLASNVVRKMIAPLRTDNRPEFTKNPPPSIYAAGHTGIAARSPRDKGLIVMALGTPKQTASFSLGKVAQNIPMVERNPGHYIGEFFALPTDKINNETIIVALTDEFGRATVQSAGLEVTFE